MKLNQKLSQFLPKNITYLCQDVDSYCMVLYKKFYFSMESGIFLYHFIAFVYELYIMFVYSLLYSFCMLKRMKSYVKKMKFGVIILALRNLMSGISLM